ncbi:hypothetical protein Ae201684_014527 [Aphanomyces euteiches]|uniref:Uncharacterized protein n=1 Tax=Aphanomyces euteiches TaxID=100861 RepID=A0A6G0WJJ9_9STRA|nr:hypothetical protein Ae201684_014527 [Aphanomyces euteiches]
MWLICSTFLALRTPMSPRKQDLLFYPMHFSHSLFGIFSQSDQIFVDGTHLDKMLKMPLSSLRPTIFTF